MINHVIKQPLLASLAFSSFIVIGFSGCSSESTDSENIRTEGIWAKMSVEGQDDGRSRVVVELNVGGEFGTNVELSDGEYLEVTAAGVTRRMTEDTDLFDVDYQTYMDTNASGTEFNIRFYRNDGQNIVGSLATMPESLVFTSPDTNNNFDYGQSVVVTWAPALAGEEISLLANITCTGVAGGISSSSEILIVEDNGLYLYDTSSAPVFDVGVASFDNSEPCLMDFGLQRESSGVLDPAFSEGGRFQISQTRYIRNIQLNLPD